MNTLNHKGYLGSVEFSEADNLLFGKVLFINDLISYEGRTIADLKKAFSEAVDEYLADCAATGKAPNKPFRGSFNVRVPPSTHQKLAFLAYRRGKSLNAFVAEALKKTVG